MPQFTPAYSFLQNVAQLDSILMESTGNTQSINNINQALVNLNDTVTGHTEQINNINLDINYLSGVTSGHTVSINNLNLDVNYLSGITSGHTQSIVNINQDLLNLNNIVTGHTSQLTSLNNTLTGHTSNTTIHITSEERNTWNAKQDANLEFTNVTVSTWVADTTYSGYGYKCDLPASGVTSTMIAFVNLGHTQAISGNYSPVSNTGTDIVTIYSKVNTTITVPSIIVFK